MSHSRIFGAAIFAFALVSAPAFANPVFSQQQQQPAAETAGRTTSATSETADQADTRRSAEVVCRTTRATGSRLGGRNQRTCLTRGEWDQIEADAQEVARNRANSGVYDGPRAN
jgi:hypothetical protein